MLFEHSAAERFALDLPQRRAESCPFEAEF
jgi:hypothetical protein